MGLVTSEKIFIDPNEEIPSVVERILSSDKSKIILVVPQNSMLLSSFVSINILFREVVKAKKSLILVTEDLYGTSVAERVGIEVVQRVSQINEENWENAMQTFSEFREFLENKKNKNLENIQYSKDYVEPQDKVEELVEEPIEEVIDTGVDSKSSSNLKEKELGKDKLDDDEIVLEDDKEIKQEDNIEENLEEEQERQFEKNKEKVIEENLPALRKPRREPRIINIDGVELLSGGDINRFDPNKQSYDTIEDLKPMEEEYIKPKKEESSSVYSREIKTFSDRGRFTGMDLKRKGAKKTFLSSIFKRDNTPKRVSEIDDLENRSRKRKMMLLGFIGIVVVLGIVTYLLAFVFSSVDISITLKKENVTTTGKIEVDTNLEEVNSVSLSIPGNLLEEKEVTLSRTGEANGEGRRGNKATGVIDILNTTEEDVTLVKGTKIKSIQTSKVYVLLNDLVIEKASDSLEGAVVTKELDVPLQAIDFGADYDITGLGSNTEFSIDGYNTDEVRATRYRDITGGTLETFVSVSQENVDSVKKTLEEDLKNEAKTKLEGLLGSGYILLDETIEYSEIKATPSPKVGEESSDKTFSLTLSVDIKALSVKEDDLNEIAGEILKNNQDTDKVIDSIEDLTIDKVEEVDDKYILTISSKGALSKNLNSTEIAEDLGGFTLEQAREYFSVFEDISRYRVVYSPGFIPSFLQRIPTDSTRVHINIQ